MTRTHPKSPAFTLVEIVVALGIFSFAITGIVFLLGTALQSSSDTQRDSALSSAVNSTAGMLRTYDNLPAPTTLYFDLQGSPLVMGKDNTAPKDAYYKFAIAPVAATVATPFLELYSIQVTAPYPAVISVGNFLVSRAKK